MNPAAAPSDAAARAGNRGPLLTWVTVVAVGELLGFVFPITAGILWADTPWAVAAIMAAGAIEGAILGLAQWSVMRRDLARLSVGAWVAVTASAAALAYALGFLPSSYATTWTVWPVLVQIAVAIPLVAALLLSIGTAQWLVLRRLVGHAWWWIPATAVAWLAGLAAFFLIAPPLWHEGQPVAVAILIGVLAGAVMALVMALVTGATWVRLVARQADPGG
jgi:hypothetical protein